MAISMQNVRAACPKGFPSPEEGVHCTKDKIFVIKAVL